LQQVGISFLCCSFIAILPHSNDKCELSNLLVIKFHIIHILIMKLILEIILDHFAQLLGVQVVQCFCIGKLILKDEPVFISFPILLGVLSIIGFKDTEIFLKSST
jgi:hypothetical protein